MAARKLMSLWEERVASDLVPPLRIPAPPPKEESAAPASPVSPPPAARRHRGVSALKPPTFPALGSARVTEVTEEPLLRSSPLSSFTSATGSASSSTSAVAPHVRRQSAQLREIDAYIAVLEHKLRRLDETLNSVERRQR